MSYTALYDKGAGWEAGCCEDLRLLDLSDTKQPPGANGFKRET